MHSLPSGTSNLCYLPNFPRQQYDYLLFARKSCASRISFNLKFFKFEVRKKIYGSRKYSSDFYGFLSWININDISALILSGD